MIALIAAGLLAFGLAACSSGSKSSSTTADMTIRNYAFTVPSVKAGSTVTVHNKDVVRHTVTADGGAFSVTVDGGSTATFKAPVIAGPYKFHCNIHSSMHATLTVT